MESFGVAVHQLLIYHRQGLLVVGGQPYFLPHAIWQVGSLDGLHVEVEDVRLFGVRADGGISAVRQRAGLSVAETADIVLVPAEIGLLLVVRCPSHCC